MTLKTVNHECETEFAYVNGESKRSNTVGVRIDNIRPGEYLCFYRQDFPNNYGYYKINLCI